MGGSGTIQNVTCSWLQYMEMVNILSIFIKAERTANWGLHLQAVSEMLPYLAASIYVIKAVRSLSNNRHLQPRCHSSVPVLIAERVKSTRDESTDGDSRERSLQHHKITTGCWQCFVRVTFYLTIRL